MHKKAESMATDLYLDELVPLLQRVGYGELGLHGALGYGGLRVVVVGEEWKHAISAHAPSLIAFDIGGRFEIFRSRVALNDDGGDSLADFTVLADGEEVASISGVSAGQPPAEISAAITGSQQLTLVAHTNRWECCHSIWLDPRVSNAVCKGPEKIVDCLSRAEIMVPENVPVRDQCIATVASAGYGPLLDRLLASIRANATCSDALLVAFLAGDDPECDRSVRRHEAVGVRLRPLATRNQTLKAALYSVASVINARRFLCLDADTVVLGDLQPIFGAMDAHPAGSILVSRDAYVRNARLLDALTTHYEGNAQDLRKLLVTPRDEGSYPFLVNDGVFAGTRIALRQLDRIIRSLRGAAAWVDERQHHGWRNQFIFNLALARLDCGVELDPIFNLQLHMNDVQISREGNKVSALWRGRPARILHFCGWGRDKYPELREFFRGPEGEVA